MTATLPGQDPRVAQIFQDMASNQRALKDADEVEQAGKRGQAAMHTEYQMRADDGLTVSVLDFDERRDVRVSPAELRDGPL